MQDGQLVPGNAVIDLVITNEDLVTPLLASCIVLANNIIKSADAVISNHDRCDRLAQRINFLLPLLKQLSTMDK